MNNIKYDSHIHSEYSWDSKNKIEDIIKESEKKDLSYIALTDHVEFSNQPLKEVINRIRKRNELIDQLQKNTNVKIIKGVEVSEPHLYEEEMNELSKIDDLDYILGSIHHVLGISLRKMANTKNIINYYLDSLYKMVNSSDIDTVAHLDYLKRYLKYGEITETDFDDILKTIIERNIALEINSSGFRRCNDPFPSLDIIKRYALLGGKNITYGSDAHIIDDIYKDIEETKEKVNNKDLNEGVVIKRRFRTF